MTLISVLWVYIHYKFLGSYEVDVENIHNSPSLEHLFGTDYMGGDHMFNVTRGIYLGFTQLLPDFVWIILVSGAIGSLAVAFIKTPKWLKKEGPRSKWIFRFLPVGVAAIYVFAGRLVAGFAPADSEPYEGFIHPRILEPLLEGYIVAAIVLSALMIFVLGKRFEVFTGKKALRFILPVLVVALIMPAAHYALVHSIYWSEPVILEGMVSENYEYNNIGNVIDMKVRQSTHVMLEFRYLGITAFGAFFFTLLSPMILATGLLPDWAWKKSKRDA